jgi:N-glycosylase/DNA lyase
MLRAATLFEDAVKVLLTTNCSWEATRGMVVRLVALAGAEGQAFPSASAVAAISPARLKTRVRVGYRAQALSRFARRVDSGKLDLSTWESAKLSSESLREAILEEYGFGPYAAENILRILGRHDFLALDSWVRKKYRQLYPGKKSSTDGSIARRYERFGSFRGLALWLDMTRDWHEEKERLWP